MIIKINTENDAFKDNMNHELAGILHGLAMNIDHNMKPTTLRDINGNICGSVEYDEE